jgi:hypothetical protein
LVILVTLRAAFCYETLLPPDEDEEAEAADQHVGRVKRAPASLSTPSSTARYLPA